MVDHAQIDRLTKWRNKVLKAYLWPIYDLFFLLTRWLVNYPTLAKFVFNKLTNSTSQQNPFFVTHISSYIQAISNIIFHGPCCLQSQHLSLTEGISCTKQYFYTSSATEFVTESGPLLNPDNFNTYYKFCFSVRCSMATGRENCPKRASADVKVQDSIPHIRIR